MFRVRRSPMRFVWLALVAMLAVAVAPTASRLLGASDPARAAVLAEICSVGMTAAAEQPADTPGSDAAGGAHCPLCLSSAVAFEWPEPDRRADNAPPARHLRPVTASLHPTGAVPVWPSAPPRAPPAHA